jgi:hypothetical protein
MASGKPDKDGTGLMARCLANGVSIEEKKAWEDLAEQWNLVDVIGVARPAVISSNENGA